MNSLLVTDTPARPIANDDAITAWNGVLFDNLLPLPSPGHGRPGTARHARHRAL
jgi:hypothetical protein